MIGRPREANAHWIIGPVAIVDVSTPKHPRACAMVDVADLPRILDGLDNRRRNLRPATVSQNNANQRSRSPNGLRGVYPRNGRWRSGIHAGGRLRWLGTFDSQTDVARAYDAAALQHFGEFARLNFPETSHAR